MQSWRGVSTPFCTFLSIFAWACKLNRSLYKFHLVKFAWLCEIDFLHMQMPFKLTLSLSFIVWLAWLCETSYNMRIEFSKLSRNAPFGLVCMAMQIWLFHVKTFFFQTKLSSHFFCKFHNLTISLHLGKHKPPWIDE